MLEVSSFIKRFQVSQTLFLCCQLGELQIEDRDYKVCLFSKFKEDTSTSKKPDRV